MLPSFPRLRVLPLLALVTAACSPVPDPGTEDLWASLCGPASCGPGRCVVDVDRPLCVCPDGFRSDGDRCLADDADPCAPNPCRTLHRTHCVTEGTSARCECDPGRTDFNGSCIVVTPCVPNPCTAPLQSVCVVAGDAPRCVCDPGHAPIETGGCDPHPVFDCSVVHTTGTPDAFEPNDCPSSATVVDIGLGPHLGHSINPAGDIDWFRLDVVQGRIYHVAVTGSTLTQLYGDVYAGDGLTPIGADHRAGTSLSMRFKATSHLAFARVRALNATAVGDYMIRADDEGPDDFADTPGQSLQIQVGSTITGKLQFDGDRDVIRLDLSAKHAYQVELDWTGPQLAQLELIAADGTTVRQQVVGTQITRTTRAAISGPLFVRVSAQPQNVTGTFELRTSSLGPDDHGDEPAEATPITPGAAPTTVSLERAGDIDVLGFNALDGHVYAVTCIPSGSAPSLSLLLLDEAETVLAQGTSWSTQGVAHETVVGGLRFIRLAHSSSWDTGPGTWKCSLKDHGKDDHGDNWLSATPLVAGAAPAVGVLETSADVDAFSFVPTAGRIYAFQCTQSGSSTACPVRLIGPGGTLVTGGQNLAWKFTSAGTWYFEVHAQYSSAFTYAYALVDLGVDDHGDTALTATAIQPGQTGSGAFEYAGDVDAFSFTATAGRIYQVTCVRQGATSCEIRLTDPTGAALATATGNAQSTTLAWKATTSGPLVMLLGGFGYQKPVGSYGWSLVDFGTDDHGDNIQTATAVMLPMSGPQWATIAASNDVDVFSFSAVEGRIYQFTCTAGTLSQCVVRLRDPSGVLVGTSSSYGVLSFIATTTGTWYAEAGANAYSGSLVGSYSWLIEELGTDDHGNTFATATTVAANGTAVGGAIQYPGDVDVFSFSATGDVIYQVSCPSGSCQLTIKLASGAVLASASGSSATAGASFKHAATGTVYVEVRAANSSQTGAYSLAVHDLGSDDHGDTPATATPLTVDGPPVSGSIGYPQDVDLFSFSATAGRIYSANCTGVSGYCGITFRNAAGVALSSGSYGSASAKAPSSGTLYVELRGYFSSTGPYTLQVTDVGVDDHGDTAATATALSGLGAAVTGSIQYSGDADFFSLPLQPGTYKVTVSGSGGLDLYVYFPAQTYLAGGSPPVTFTATVAGTYYFRVTAWTSSGVGSTWILSVQ